MAVNFGINPFDIVGTIGSIVNTHQINKTNLQISRETNQANREMVEMQNKAAREEAEKAYKRSSAPNQVAQMMSAGMSRAGAINALNGGGSYTPAPVNVSQDSAPQMQTTDLSALSNVMQIQSQKATEKHQEKLQREQLAAQKEENAANRQNAKEIATIQANASKYGVDQNTTVALERLKFDKEQFDKLSPYQIRQIEANINKLEADKSLTDKQASDLAYRMAEYQSQPYKTVRDTENLVKGLQADFDYRISEKSFADYLNENYDYVNGEYVPKKWISNANKVQNAARAVWNTIFEIVPLNLLLESLGGTVENVRALKMLSKFK